MLQSADRSKSKQASCRLAKGRIAEMRIHGVLAAVVLVALASGVASFIVAPVPLPCPPDKPLVHCFADPCFTPDAVCPAYPTAQCRPNFCGGCNREWFLFGEKVDCDKNVCKLPPDTGLCKALFRRWFFNYKTGKCEKFIYGGCGGNANNFETEAECKKACGGNIGICGKEGEDCRDLSTESIQLRPCCKGLQCCPCSGRPLPAPIATCQPATRGCNCPKG